MRNKINENPYGIYRHYSSGGSRLIVINYEIPEEYLMIKDEFGEYNIETGYVRMMRSIMLDPLKERIKPFLEDISEEEVIENLGRYNLDDCLKTQDWGDNPSDEILLLKELGESHQIDVYKFSEELFLSFIRMNYFGKNILVEMDDIESVDLRVTYNYGKVSNFGEVVIEDIKFKNPDDVTRLNALKLMNGDDPHGSEDIAYFISEELLLHYTGSKLVIQSLAGDYMLEPVMFFDYNLYKIFEDNDKFNIRVEVIE